MADIAAIARSPRLVQSDTQVQAATFADNVVIAGWQGYKKFRQSGQAVPAAVEIRQKAQALGYLDIFERAGAQILKSGCGACINSGLGVLAKEETGVYATNRNFKGRSGDPTGKNYLASPRTVAISAVKGKISHDLD